MKLVLFLNYNIELTDYSVHFYNIVFSYITKFRLCDNVLEYMNKKKNYKYLLKIQTISGKTMALQPTLCNNNITVYIDRYYVTNNCFKRYIIIIISNRCQFV